MKIYLAGDAFSLNREKEWLKYIKKRLLSWWFIKDKFKRMIK